MKFLKNIIVILIGLISIAINIPVSASSVILGQSHQSSISETYTYDEILLSAFVKYERTCGLSRVLSKEKVGSGGEALGAVTSVTAIGAIGFADDTVGLTTSS